MNIEVKRKKQLLTICFERKELDRFTATAEINGIPISKDFYGFRNIWLDIGDQLILRIPIAGSFLDGTTSCSS